MGDNEKLREKVRAVIGEVVPAYGMALADKDAWAKSHGWKTDEVALGFKPTKFYVNVYVSLPPEPGTPFDSETLAFKNLPTLCGNSDSVYRYPGFGQTSRLLTRIEEELKQGMAWFETLNSPQACLEYLLADTSANPISPGYKYRESYLKKLVDGAS